jgi:hypothetical protein
MNYYYSIDGAEVIGPYSFDELKADFLSGALPGNTKVCAEGKEDWQTLKSLFQPPSAHLATLPATPAQQIPQPTFRDLLGKYVNQTIGVNCKEPKQYHPAELVAVSDEFFSIFVADKSITVHYPYHQIAHVIEAKGGVSTPGFFSSKQYPVVVEVMQLIVYSGGIGVSIPI